jgi:hypothetical protein
MSTAYTVDKDTETALLTALHHADDTTSAIGTAAIISSLHSRAGAPAVLACCQLICADIEEHVGITAVKQLLGPQGRAELAVELDGKPVNPDDYAHVPAIRNYMRGFRFLAAYLGSELVLQEEIAAEDGSGGALLCASLCLVRRRCPVPAAD